VAVEHLVLMNRKPGSVLEEAERLLQSARRQFRALPGVLDVRVGVRNAQDGVPPSAYCFLMRFADPQSLAAFLPHPVHAAVGKQLREHFMDFAVHDFAELGSQPEERT